jgi:hypothetical protein
MVCSCDSQKEEGVAAAKPQVSYTQIPPAVPGTGGEIILPALVCSWLQYSK